MDDSLARRGVSLLWHSVRTHPRPFALAVTGAVLFSLMAIAGAIVLGRVTDEVILPAFEGGVDRSDVWAGAAMIVGVALLRVIGVVLRRLFGNMTQRRMQRSWFTRVTDRYLDVPLSWLRERPAGQLLAHADADAEQATRVMLPLPFSLSVIVIILAASVQLAIIDLALAAVGLAVFPSLALVNHVYSRRVETPAAQAQAAVGRVSAVAHESFDGALVVKTLGLADREVQRLAIVASDLRRDRIQVGRLRAGFEPALDALPNLGTVALLAAGSWRISHGVMTTGELVQAMALFSILALPMRVVGLLLEELPRAVVAHDRVRRVLAAPARREPSDPLPLPAGPLSIELDDVRFSHGSDVVLDGLSARVRPGEVVAVVGATGSGKSTLCELLVGLVEPDSGTIRLGGAPVERIATDERVGAVALAFQEAFLFGDSVRDNLTLGAAIDESELLTALELACARTFVERLPAGLDQIVGERGVTLSGGQRQRLALARALLRRPRLLLLDDATSAVDPLVEQQILDGLRGSLDATALVVAHRIATIRLADRILYLEGGRIAATGSHDELLAQPGYAALAQAYAAEDDAVGVVP